MPATVPINRVWILFSCSLLLIGCQQPRLNSRAKQIPSDTGRVFIYAQKDGRVEQLLVASGQTVKAGDALLQLGSKQSQTQSGSEVEKSIDNDIARLTSRIRSGMISNVPENETSALYLMALDVIAHNLANVNTTAFKRLRVELQEVLPQSGQELSAPSMTGALLVGGLQTGHGARAICTMRNFSMGELLRTGEPLDVAIKGDGFFEVVLPDGTKAYTRDGAFRTGADGRFTMADGFPLGSGFQPIEPGTTTITIGPEGMITHLNQKGAKSFELHICRFANPAGMQSIGRNLYGETMASGMAEYGSPGQKGFGELVQGFLERSNVDLVEEVQDLIRLQTAFDAYATVSEMTRKLRTRLSTTAQSTTAMSR